jgi:hypothetical protein
MLARRAETAEGSDEDRQIDDREDLGNRIVMLSHLRRLRSILCAVKYHVSAR